MKKKIGILGLGYVGLPLAVRLSLKFQVIGFDISSLRVSQLHKGIDNTREITKKDLLNSLNKGLFITNDYRDLSTCKIYIATVPTPIDKNKNPDFTALINVCKTIGPLLKRGNIVIFESTVHPGATEDICGIELEKSSTNLKSGVDFFLGYSPERVNPGDKKHTINRINKVISAQNKKVEKIMFDIYSKLTTGEVFTAKSIKVAEASKVIENSQRDINIAFINEITKICDRLEISIYDVLDASLTKWNFLDFKPGLVGGHCIGVDPYYLSKKAQDLGINPQVILSGRKTNDEMSSFVSDIFKKKVKRGSTVLFLGVTFKENVPDMRNSKAIDVMKELSSDYDISYNDPFVKDLNDFKYHELNKNTRFDAIILCVPHESYLKIGFLKLNKSLKKNGVFFDVKGIFRRERKKNYFCL